MEIAYREQSTFTQAALEELYGSVGWTAYTDQAQDLVPMLENSLYNISSWDGERLVGLARAVGDGYVIGYIQDILVHPDYQRLGIGRHLLQATFQALKPARQIVLMTDNDPKTISFYQSLGMTDIEEWGGKCFTLKD